MNPALLDLRSDFVARPTAEMVAFAAAAAERPAAFLPWEDPLVQELETLGAALFGRRNASFVINCTTANYLALCHFAAGAELVVLPAQSHIVRHEAALLPLATAGREVIVTEDPLQVSAAALEQGRQVLLTLENSDLYRCGRALDASELAGYRAMKAGAGGRLSLHLDGSRIFNAQAAAGYDLRRDLDFVDSLSVSLNKGLAAPVGALLVGEAALIEAANARALAEARFVRPAHVPAAYALAALRQTPPDLAADNRRAAALAASLESCPPLRVEYGGTNLLFLVLPSVKLADALLAALGQHGILARIFRDPATLRLVFHRDIDDAALARLEAVIPELCRLLRD